MSERIDDPTFKANDHGSAQKENFSFGSHIYHTTNDENLLFSPDKVNPFQKHFSPAPTEQSALAQNQGGATVDQNRQRQYEKEWEQSLSREWPLNTLAAKPVSWYKPNHPGALR